MPPPPRVDRYAAEGGHSAASRSDPASGQPRQSASPEPASSTPAPTLEHELAAWRRGAVVVGVDEVGRGALAGPVVAGAVAFDPTFGGLVDAPGLPPPSLRGVRDSKLTPPDERASLAEQVCGCALAWATGWASAAEVDALGIARAVEVAMLRALDGLGRPIDLVLVDGYPLRGLRARGTEQLAVVRGDRTVFSIAAASLVAKVRRDAALIGLASVHAEYGLDRNKGYASPEHLRALTLHGPTPEHRLTWAPVSAVCASPLDGNDRPTTTVPATAT